jgi:hypothetical protein
MNDEIKKLPGKTPRGMPFGEKRSGKSSEIRKMPGKTPRGMPFGEKSSGKSSEIMKMPGKTPRGMPFGEAVGADNKVRMNDADERASRYRTDAMMEEGYKKGGKVPKGMHRMPDGKMMKDSEHKKPKKMMGGGMMKYAHGGSIDGCATRGKTKGRMI